jgi:hypothetical protein
MSWVATAIVGGSLLTGYASYAGSQGASRAAQRGADAATGEQARQFDLIRGDTAGLRSIQGSALGTLASLYGWAPPSQGQFADPSRPLVMDSGGVPTVDSSRYQSDPAYRYAWDKTLAWEKSNRPGWDGQQTYWAKATGEDWSRLNELMAKNLSEYNAQHPQEASAATGTGRPNMGAFFESPDYQFNLGEGQKAIDRSLAARGRSLSGAGVKEGIRYASGMASGEYGKFVDRLLAAAGLGTTGVSLSANAGMNAANNIGAAQMNAANTRASGYMNAAAGINNAVQGGISNYMLYQYLNKPPAAVGAGG